MSATRKLIRVVTFSALTAVLLAACGGGDSGGSGGGGGGGGGSGGGGTTTYTIGGTVTGLTGTVVLQNNAGNNLSVAASGAFTFTTAVNSGATYAVTVLTQPAGQTCTVASGSGTASANVTAVAVTCTTNRYSIGGTITGLTSGTVVLQNNAGDNLSRSANGAFTFATTINSGSAYAVTVLTQPTGLTCTVATGSGTASANVTNVAITCTVIQYTIGGTVTGLNGPLVLDDSQSEMSLAVTASGNYQFNSTVGHGSPYVIGVFNQPLGQTCTPSNASGTATANVANVNVNCTNNPLTISGTVSGLTGTIVLQNNLGDNITVSNGGFAFPKGLVSGSSYMVTVLASGPATQGCTIVNGIGASITTSVSNVSVSCSALPTTVSIGGNVNGLTGTVVLHNAASNEDYAVIANGPFTFPTQVALNSNYYVSVKTQPVGMTCSVLNASGTSNVTTALVLVVSCAGVTETHLISGTVTGLKAPLKLVLNMSNNALDVAPAGGATVPFSFPVGVPFNSEYSVLVRTHPTGQTCLIPHSGSHVAHADITDVVVICVDNVTDPLIGTFSAYGGDFMLTLYPNGAYVYASVDDDATCGASQGSGIEMGTYRYNATTGAFVLGSNVIDTNGATCGIWRNGASAVNGTLQKIGSGQGTVLIITSPGITGGPAALVSVPAFPLLPIGSVTSGDLSFLVLGLDNHYFEVHVNDDPASSAPAGLEFGCYTRSGSNTGTITVTPMSSCTGAIDTDNTAGLSGEAGSPIPYTAGPFVLNFNSGEFFGFRIIPN